MPENTHPLKRLQQYQHFYGASQKGRHRSYISLNSVWKKTRHETEDTKPRTGGQNPYSWRPGEDGTGGGWGQTQVGQQSPVSAHLCGLLCGTGQRLEVPVPVSEPWRRYAWITSGQYIGRLKLSFFYLFVFRMKYESVMENFLCRFEQSAQTVSAIQWKRITLRLKLNKTRMFHFQELLWFHFLSCWFWRESHCCT